MESVHRPIKTRAGKAQPDSRPLWAQSLNEHFPISEAANSRKQEIARRNKKVHGHRQPEEVFPKSSVAEAFNVTLELARRRGGSEEQVGSYLGVSFNSLLVSGVSGDMLAVPLSVNT